MSKKLILAAAFITGFASSALAAANNPVVTLGGTLDTQYGILSEKSEFRHATPTSTSSERRRDHALVNDAKVLVRVDGKTDCGHKYGGFMKLNADTSDDKFGDEYNAQQTMAYLEGVYGRFEAGSYTGASHALHVNTEHLAKGTGGVHGDWWLWINPRDGSNSTVSGASGNFMPLATLYTNNVSVVGVKSVNASKINYFTPVFQGWSAGVSYVPDLESYGTINSASGVYKTEADNPGMYRDIFEGGVHYAGKMNHFAFKAALVGQTGNAKRYSSSTYKRLRAWEAGVAVQYMHLMFAGAYGDHGKSGQPSTTVGTKSRYWNVGASYEHGPFGVSLTYADTKRGVNDSGNESGKFQVAALGGDFHLARGVKLYGDVTHFSEKRKGIALKNRGTVVLVGSKLNF